MSGTSTHDRQRQSEPPRSRRRARLAAAICAAYFALLAALQYHVWYGPYDESGYHATLALLALAGYYGVAAWWLGRWSIRARAVAFGTGWIVAFGLSSLGIAGLAAVSFAALFYGGWTVLLVVLYPIVVLVAMPVILANRSLLVHTGPVGALARGGWRILTIGFAAFPVFAGLVVAVVEWADRRHASYATPDAVRAIWSVQACAHRYAARHPARGFPATGEELARWDADCSLNELSKHRPYTLEYETDVGAPGSRVLAFVVRLRQRHLPFQRYQSLLGDAAGRVHYARDGDATAADPLVSGHVDESGILRIRSCVWHHHKSEPYPANAADDCRLNGAVSVAPGVLDYHGYRVRYEPVGLDDSGTRSSSFQLRARPREYGRTGVRSYLLVLRRAVHATGEDRDALPSDPVVDYEEYEGTRP